MPLTLPIYVCVYVSLCTWTNINQIILCLAFCGPLSWNHAIKSIAAPLPLNLNVIHIPKKEETIPTRWNHSLILFVLSFVFFCSLSIGNDRDRRRRQKVTFPLCQMMLCILYDSFLLRYHHASKRNSFESEKVDYRFWV